LRSPRVRRSPVAWPGQRWRGGGVAGRGGAMAAPGGQGGAGQSRAAACTSLDRSTRASFLGSGQRTGRPRAGAAWGSRAAGSSGCCSCLQQPAPGSSSSCTSRRRSGPRGPGPGPGRGCGTRGAQGGRPVHSSRPPRGPQCGDSQGGPGSWSLALLSSLPGIPRPLPGLLEGPERCAPATSPPPPPSHLG
jgi:hypothetical protein